MHLLHGQHPDLSNTISGLAYCHSLLNGLPVPFRICWNRRCMSLGGLNSLNVSILLEVKAKGLPPAPAPQVLIHFFIWALTSFSFSSAFCIPAWAWPPSNVPATRPPTYPHLASPIPNVLAQISEWLRSSLPPTLWSNVTFSVWPELQTLS